MGVVHWNLDQVPKYFRNHLYTITSSMCCRPGERVPVEPALSHLSVQDLSLVPTSNQDQHTCRREALDFSAGSCQVFLVRQGRMS